MFIIFRYKARTHFQANWAAVVLVDGSNATTKDTLSKRDNKSVGWRVRRASDDTS